MLAWEKRKAAGPEIICLGSGSLNGIYTVILGLHTALSDKRSGIHNMYKKV